MYILTGGLFFLALRWMPNYWALFNLKSSDDYTGDLVAITDQSATIYVKLSTVDGKLINQFIPHLLPPQPTDNIDFYHTVEYKKNLYFMKNQM